MPIASTRFPPSERALAAAASAFGYRTAAMLAGAVLRRHCRPSRLARRLLAGGRVSWPPPCWRRSGRREPRSAGPAAAYPGRRGLASAARTVQLRRASWGFLALVLLYKVGDALALSLYSTFMIRGVGFSLMNSSIAGKLNMTVSTMIGVAFGGMDVHALGDVPLAADFRHRPGAHQSALHVARARGQEVWLLVLATSLDTMIGGMGQAAFVAFLVSLCSADFSATQYALLSALATLPRNSSGAIAGSSSRRRLGEFLRGHLPAAVPGLILLVFLRRPVERTGRARQRHEAAPRTQ